MNELTDEINNLLATLRDAAQQIRDAKAMIDKQNAAAERWLALVKKSNALADQAITELKKRNEALTSAKRTMLEQAVRYENEQLYYSHNDSKNHDLCRIANERLNGVYAVMPTLFNKSQRECIDLVRETAAKGRMAE